MIVLGMAPKAEERRDCEDGAISRWSAKGAKNAYGFWVGRWLRWTWSGASALVPS